MTDKNAKVGSVEIRYYAEYDSSKDPLQSYVWLGRTVRYPGGLRGEVLADGSFERDQTILGAVSGNGGYTGVRELSESEVRELVADHPAGADEVLKFEQRRDAVAR